MALRFPKFPRQRERVLRRQDGLRIGRVLPDPWLTGALLGLLAIGCAKRPELAVTLDTWQTHAERTNFVETGRYDEALALCRRLAEASPYARYTSFGVSGEGRALPLLILSKDRAFSPESARKSQQPLVLIQNCIHAGECEGKDACFILARELLVTGELADLFDRVNVLIVPIFNVDGHERFGPHNRVNQNGPQEMGWRVTATNLNLNRDYVKADAVEMQAWLRLWTAWQPDLFIDTHTTDGHEDQYDVYYAVTDGPDIAEPVAAWVQRQLMPGVLSALDDAGFLHLPYSFPRDARDPTKGFMHVGTMSPRLSTGYAAACNRPGILIETHATKPYGRRVRVTYEFLRATLRTVGEQGATLRGALGAADEQAVRERGATHDGQVPLRFEHTEQTRRITYRGVAQQMRPSEITGAEIIEYSATPLDVETDFFDESRITSAVAPPDAYLIPPQWEAVISLLDLHGIRYTRLPAPQTRAVQTYRFEDVKFRESPYESRQMPTFRAAPCDARREFPAGTIVVPLDQPRAKLAVHLLEPDAPDSLVAWGFFNAIFEQKEYFEAYIFEPLAQQMLATDPALKAEFEERLRTDADFAASPERRLEFLYRRSPCYDERHNAYPVARRVDN